MNQEKSSVLGHLIEVTSQLFIAKLKTDLDGLNSDKMIGMDKVRIGQVGSYLMVTQSDTKMERGRVRALSLLHMTCAATLWPWNAF